MPAGVSMQQSDTIKVSATVTVRGSTPQAASAAAATLGDALAKAFGGAVTSTSKARGR